MSLESERIRNFTVHCQSQGRADAQSLNPVVSSDSRTLTAKSPRQSQRGSPVCSPNIPHFTFCARRVAGAAHRRRRRQHLVLGRVGVAGRRRGVAYVGGAVHPALRHQQLGHVSRPNPPKALTSTNIPPPPPPPPPSPQPPSTVKTVWGIL